MLRVLAEGDPHHISYPSVPRGNAPNAVDPFAPLSKPKSKTAVVLVDVKVDLKTDDPFGQVSGGFIRLRGPLCRMNYKRIQGQGDVVLSINEETYPEGMVRRFWDCTPGLPEMEDTGLTTNFSPACIYLLPFYPYPEPEDIGYGMVGLMLLPTGRKEGQYSRLGIFDVPGWDAASCAERCNQIVRACRTTVLERHCYLEHDGGDAYTIELV